MTSAATMDQLPQLSSREQEVVNLLQQGKSNKMIASSLGISERTVEFHLKNVYDKFRVGSRVELVLKLGESTVAERAETAEDRDGPDSRNWVTPLREAVSIIGKDLRMATTLKTDAGDESDSNTMTFFQAIRVCFIKYAEFQGRASRPEFWWFALFVLLVTTAFTYINEALGSVSLIAVLLPFLAVGARRLHDCGKSHWWLLYLLVPVGGIIIMGWAWSLPTVEQPADDTLPA